MRNNNPWIEDGTLGEEAQGAFAPESLPDGAIVYSRRFIRDNHNGTWTVMNLYVAPNFQSFYDIDVAQTEFEVVELWEVIECSDPTDPGSSELDSNYDYDFVNDRLIDSINRANEDARKYASINFLERLNYGLPVTA